MRTSTSLIIRTAVCGAALIAFLAAGVVAGDKDDMLGVLIAVAFMLVLALRFDKLVTLLINELEREDWNRRAAMRRHPAGKQL